MKSTGITNSEPQASGCAGSDINEVLLRSEIGFWRDMIDSCDDQQPSDSVERMQQALALAESRLRELFESYQNAHKARTAHPSNVFWLDRASGRNDRPKRAGR